MPRSRGFGLLLVCTVAVVAACSGGSDTLDGKDVEQTISKQLRKDFTGASIGATRCPKEINKKTGDEFTCTATVGNEPVPIAVTQTETDPPATESSGVSRSSTSRRSRTSCRRSTTRRWGFR